MEIPLQLIVFSLPALAYILVVHRRGLLWREALGRLGFAPSPPVYYLWGVGVLLATGTLAVLALNGIPNDVLRGPNVSLSQYEDMTFSLGAVLLVFFREAFYATLGEEILFRGLLGGLLFRRFGFAVGNAVQAGLFLLPHLLLLLVSLSLWRLVLVQLLLGWLLGWIRHKSGSILPGWMAHTLANTLGALAVL